MTRLRRAFRVASIGVTLLMVAVVDATRRHTDWLDLLQSEDVFWRVAGMLGSQAGALVVSVLAVWVTATVIATGLAYAVLRSSDSQFEAKMLALRERAKLRSEHDANVVSGEGEK